MEMAKKFVSHGVMIVMLCLTCLVLFGSGVIAEATSYSSYTPYTSYSGNLGIHGTKTLSGRGFQEGDQFTFQIKPQYGAPTPTDAAGNPVETVTIRPAASENSAKIDFDARFTFTLPGTYVYLISEVQPQGLPAGIVYDRTVYRLTVKVSPVSDQNGNVGEEETAGVTGDLAGAEVGQGAGTDPAG